MLNIEDADKKVQQVDSLLTSITKLLKKHWLILIFIAIIAFGYWAWNLPEEEALPETETEVDETEPLLQNESSEENTSDDPIYSEDVVDSVYYEDDSTVVN